MIRPLVCSVLIGFLSTSALASPGWGARGKPALLRVSARPATSKKNRVVVTVARNPEVPTGLLVSIRKHFGTPGKQIVSLKPGEMTRWILTTDALRNPLTTHAPDTAREVELDPFAEHDPNALPDHHVVGAMYREFTDLQDGIHALPPEAAMLRRTQLGEVSQQIGELSLSVDQLHLATWRFPKGDRSYFRIAADSAGGALVGARLISSPPLLYLVEFNSENAPAAR